MRILVTGITGTLGTALTQFLLEDGHTVIGYSRDEFKQSKLSFKDKVTLYLGDVRDRDRVLEASRGCDWIFHLAALKHVDKLEENPEESIKTNILGTQNVLHAQRINHIPKLIFSSTDKAVFPINSYGMSKALAERLVLRNPKNVICRYGNVIGSRGSVIPVFVNSLKETGTLRITDKKMTRFWIRPQDAAAFVYSCSNYEIGGLRIPPMKAYPVVKLGLLVADILKISSPIIEEIGLRAGEKIHEHLRTEDEGGYLASSEQSLWFKESEIRELIESVIEEL